MEHPVKEVRNVIRSLTQGTPDEQQDAVYRYFSPGASFVHPFCRVPSFVGVKVPGVGELDSRALILAILKWYKMLSPKIELEIESCVFDQRTNLLYVKISQVFSIWLIPFHRAPVSLVSVLHLVPSPGPSSTANGAHTTTNTTIAAADDFRITGFVATQEQAIDASREKRQHIEQGSEPSYAKVAKTGEPSASPDQDKDEQLQQQQEQQQQQQQQQPQWGKRKGGHSRSASQGGAGTGAGAGDAGAGRPTRYYIKKQEDLYQVNEFVKFVLMAPGASLCGLFQLGATLFCAAGVLLLSPVVRAVGVAGRGKERVA
jgi:hypothetical protein